MADVSVICFSKDRPLQLHAYLESIMYCSGIGQADIAVLYKDSEAIPYDLVMGNFPDVVWVKESDFMSDLMTLVQDAADVVWWGCDDTVFKSEFDLGYCVRAFEDPEIFGVMLRRGLNLDGADRWKFCLQSHNSDDGTMTWNRRIGGTGYAWEVSSAMYPKSMVLDMFEQCVVFEEHTREQASKANNIEYALGVEYPFTDLVKGPNMLEWTPYHGPLRCTDRTHMVGFDFSKSVSLAINRVQDVMINTSDGRAGTDVEYLYDAYVAGRRQDWRSLMGWANLYRHENADRFKLI